MINSKVKCGDSMANYTNSINKMSFRVLEIMLEYERKGFLMETGAVKVTMKDWIILRTLHESGEISISDLANSVAFENGQVKTLISKLQKSGVLLKTQSEKDKRVFYLILTDKGKRVVNEMAVREKEMLNFLLGDVSINEEKGILKYLSKIVQVTTGKIEMNMFDKKSKNTKKD